MWESGIFHRAQRQDILPRGHVVYVHKSAVNSSQPFETKCSTQSLEEMEKQREDILYLEKHRGSSEVDPSAESTGATRRELQVVNRWVTTFQHNLSFVRERCLHKAS